MSPRYSILATTLLEEIAEGTHPVGHLLPSEHELAELHDVSRSTVRAALLQLQHLGIISRRRGAGTRVEASRPTAASAAYNQSLGTFDDLVQYAALDIVERDLATLASILADLAAKHRDTPMAGRTHLQQALPITFGYKAAIWLAGIERHRERLTQLKPRVLVGEFSGAAGTLASVGAGGLEMQRLFCEELDLDQPTITWHVARDGLAETVALLGLITGSLAKIATDVMLMMATEFGEVSEPFVPGRGASSTMPQKRNPISSELILAAAKAVRQHVATMLDGMIHDFERATGPWHLEWVALPESFLLTASALANANFMLGGLVVHEKRMRANLDLTGGLIVAEAVMMAAAPKLGRQHAHDVVYGACRQAIEEGGRLADILAGMPEVVTALGSREAIERCCDPANYLGLAGEMVDRVLGKTPAAARPAA